MAQQPPPPKIVKSTSDLMGEENAENNLLESEATSPKALSRTGSELGESLEPASKRISKDSVAWKLLKPAPKEEQFGEGSFPPHLVSSAA